MTTSELPTYGEEEIRARLDAELPAWSYGGAWLERELTSGTRGGALLAASAIAYLAEAAHHHPDLEIRGNRVLVQVRHHWAAGVTDADFELAHAVEGFLARVRGPRPAGGGRGP